MKLLGEIKMYTATVILELSSHGGCVANFKKVRTLSIEPQSGQSVKIAEAKGQIFKIEHVFDEDVIPLRIWCKCHYERPTECKKIYDQLTKDNWVNVWKDENNAIFHK
jgi:hypothetical protein